MYNSEHSGITKKEAYSRRKICIFFSGSLRWWSSGYVFPVAVISFFDQFISVCCRFISSFGCYRQQYFECCDLICYIEAFNMERMKYLNTQRTLVYLRVKSHLCKLNLFTLRDSQQIHTKRFVVPRCLISVAFCCSNIVSNTQCDIACDSPVHWMKIDSSRCLYIQRWKKKKDRWQ